MPSASLNLHEIETAHDYLLLAELSVELDEKDVLGEDDFPVAAR